MAILSFQIKKYCYHQNNYVDRYIWIVSLNCVSQNRQKDKMCTLIVTIRTVLWYVMSLAGTLLILVACFTDRWLHRPSLQERLTDMEGTEGFTFFCISIILDDKIMSALIYMKIVYYRFCWNGKERHNLRFRWGDLWRSKRKYWIIREMHGTYFRMIKINIYH